MGKSSLSRCDLKQNLIKEGCSAAAIEFPSSSLRIQMDNPLSDKASATADVTQIRPQKLHMALRMGKLVLSVMTKMFLNPLFLYDDVFCLNKIFLPSFLKPFPQGIPSVSQ